MKQSYEKPVLTTELFDVQDVIAASSLDTVNTNNAHNFHTFEGPQLQFPFGV